MAAQKDVPSSTGDGVCTNVGRNILILPYYQQQLIEQSGFNSSGRYVVCLLRADASPCHIELFSNGALSETMYIPARCTADENQSSSFGVITGHRPAHGVPIVSPDIFRALPKTKFAPLRSDRIIYQIDHMENGFAIAELALLSILNF